MNQLQITEAEVTDAAAISSLVNRAYRPMPGAEGWTHESALVSGHRVDRQNVLSAIQGHIVLVGRLEQALVGCVQIEMQGHAAHIGMLAVEPSVQTFGIGKVLLERAEAYAIQKHGAERAVLLVIAVRTELIAFYFRRGYSLADEQLQYPVDAGFGTPMKAAMRLVKLQKVFSGQSVV